MKNKCTSIFFFCLICFFPAFSYGDSTDWILRKNENGISVYTRQAENSGLKEVRVLNVVQSSLSAIVALLLDVKNYPNWIYACSEASVLKEVSNKEHFQYEVTDAPWPVSDRDVISHFKLEQDSITKIVTVTNIGEPDYLPEKAGRVRVQHFQSNYKLTPLPGGKVKVEFELFVDPGGNIPAWLINSSIVNAPFKTSLALIRDLPNYQNIRFSFIIEQ